MWFAPLVRIVGFSRGAGGGWVRGFGGLGKNRRSGTLANGLIRKGCDRIWGWGQKGSREEKKLSKRTKKEEGRENWGVCQKEDLG